MNPIAELAGFFAARAIWCVSDDGPLVPIYAYELESGQRGMDRLIVADSGEAQTVGRERLRNNPHGAVRGVLVYDAFVNSGGLRHDAIVIESQDYVAGVTLTILVPYRPVDSPEGFGVLPAELFAHSGLNIERSREVLEPFFAGVDSHEKGGDVWNAHLLEHD